MHTEHQQICNERTMERERDSSNCMCVAFSSLHSFRFICFVFFVPVFHLFSFLIRFLYFFFSFARTLNQNISLDAYLSVLLGIHKLTSTHTRKQSRTNACVWLMFLTNPFRSISFKLNVNDS